MILWAQGQSQEEGLCCCGQWATSKLSYADEVAHWGALSAFTPLPLLTGQLYRTPPVEQVTVLVPVLEDILLPSPNVSEDNALPVPSPCTPTQGHLLSGQHCWTRCKFDEDAGSGSAHLFQTPPDYEGRITIDPIILD